MAVTTQWLQNVAYAARIDRTLIDNLWTEGVLGAGSFLVSERGAGTNMTVDITAGVAVVTGDDQAFQGKYLCREQAATTGVTITTAPGSGTRHDLVVLQIQDPNAGGAAGDNAVLKVIAGATGNSTDPAVPDSALVLARVRVATGTAAITDAMIDDLRVGSRLSHEVVNTAAIDDSAVTESKLQNGSVTVNKIGNLAVDVNKLAANAVTTAKINNGAVTSAKIAAGAVTNSELGTGAVSQAKILDGAVLEAKLADAAVTNSKIASGVVSSGKLASPAVFAGNIADGAVTEAKLNSAVLSSAWADTAFAAGGGAPDAGTRFRHKRVGNIVYLNGGAKRTSEGTALATLPVGFRPASAQLYWVAYAGNTTLQVQITTAGAINFVGAVSGGTEAYLSVAFEGA